ncbi:DUF5518 domain-containing protein [Halomicroarcula sp. GCM10025709]|uniref:DUF5518 domain-containing protein n=1 Tax=Haloarcula TaxID=2237 RepID=UPI0024C2FEF6|nr:DUF5518 domain-containing protein [Halomicroarcula sp. YJ-61-S]
MVNWIAVLYGIVTAFAIGLASGLGLPFTSITLPIVGAGVTGLVAGGVAGYFAREGLGSGIVHGFLATSIGGLLVGLVLLLTGTIVAGVIGFSAGVVFLTLVAAHGIPGAVGGAIGGILGRGSATTGQPTT